MRSSSIGSTRTRQTRLIGGTYKRVCPEHLWRLTTLIELDHNVGDGGFSQYLDNTFHQQFPDLLETVRIYGDQDLVRRLRTASRGETWIGRWKRALELAHEDVVRNRAGQPLDEREDMLKWLMPSNKFDEWYYEGGAIGFHRVAQAVLLAGRQTLFEVRPTTTGNIGIILDEGEAGFEVRTALIAQ